MAPRSPIRSDIAHSTPEAVTVKGRNLADDILGSVDLGQMAFLMLTDRLPDPAESRMFNALAVSLVEHGLTPSVIAARMTLAGAPEAMQAAVAAGLAGLGSIYVGSTETCARMLQEAIPDRSAPPDIEETARQIAERFIASKTIIPGIGHRLHKPVDPRAERLFAISAETGFSGPYVGLMQAIAQQAARQTGKTLPINATGAVGAIACELGLPWTIVRGVGVLARAIGLVGHLREELERPMALQIKEMAERAAYAHLREDPEDP
jgi:citrate synthase